jgi:hypothetical protein
MGIPDIVFVDELLTSLKILGSVASMYEGYAVEHGYLKLLELIKLQDYPMNSNVCLVAARNNRIDILKWLMELEEFEFNWLKEIAQGSIEGGHLEILQWVEDMGYSVGPDIGFLICEQGHVELLKYWHQKGKEIPESWYFHAITFNQLAIIQYMKLINISWNKPICILVASKYGTSELIEWVKEN